MVQPVPQVRNVLQETAIMFAVKQEKPAVNIIRIVLVGKHAILTCIIALHQAEQNNIAKHVQMITNALQYIVEILAQVEKNAQILM